MIRTGKPQRLRRHGITGVALAWGLLSALACTCSHTPSRGIAAGELGKGVFIYRCVDETDGACPFDGEKPEDFPAFVALGGRFEVLYETFADGPQVDVQSPTSQLADDGTAFTAVEPGWAAVAAYDGQALLDVLHLVVVEPAELVLDVDTAQLDVDDGTTITASVYTDDGERCAGALPYEWTVDPPGIVGLSGDQPNNRRHVVALAPGVATVSVTDGVREVSLALEVLPGNVPPDSTGSTTGSTASTADTGTAVGSTP